MTAQLLRYTAFSRDPAGGNPAGVWLGARLPDADRMQGIAAQVGDSETAFVAAPGADGRRPTRYFSPEAEVPFCGHATIAVMHDLLSTREDLRARGEVMIQVGGASLAVVNDIAAGNAMYITAPAPKHLPMRVDIDDLTRALNCSMADFDGDYPMALVNAGLATLLVPVRRASALADVKPDMERLTKLCEDYGVDTVLIFSDDVIQPTNAYRTRVFAPRFGYLEDPATGSGNAALGYYLLRQGRWQGAPISIEQGVSYRNPNIVRLRAAEATGERRRVLFGGSAVVRIDGSYLLS